MSALERLDALETLAESLKDPRFIDAVAGLYPDAKLAFDQRLYARHMDLPRFATVIVREEDHLVNVSVHGEPEPELNAGWTMIAVYDLDTGEMVFG